MKRLVALAAAVGLFFAAPAFAQQIETLPSGKKIKIVEKEDGTVIILPIEESADSEAENTDEDASKSVEEEFDEAEFEDDFDGELPQRVKDLLERLRKDFERDSDRDSEEPDDNQPRVKIVPWGEGKDMPEDMRKAMDEMRERMEKFRKEAEERFEKMRKEMEENWGDSEAWEDDTDVEIEEYEKEAPDGSWKVKVKIVRKTSKSEGSAPEAPPETPKKSESERKQ